MDAHFRSFEHDVLPVLLQEEIGVLGMKAMGGGGILKSGAVSAVECLRYALSLPAATVITGIDSAAILTQALETASNFRPLSATERAALLKRTEAPSRNGEFEWFKTSARFDSTAENPQWLGHLLKA